MLKKIYIILITAIVTITILFCFKISEAHSETVPRENTNSLIVEWTPQVMLRGIEDLGCLTTVTIIIDSELRGREYREVREVYRYQDLCLEQQIQYEIDNQKF